MCEICGICSVGSIPIEPTLLEKMNATLIHRGPDGTGYFLDGLVGLAMCRLAIIDLNTGDQPIFNEDRTVAIVFNGEIYNYRQLRDELMGKGHRFATRSDTKVIVHAYEEWGEDCPRHLTGCSPLPSGMRPASAFSWPESVGDDYPARLHRLAADLGLADQVVFTGHLEDVRPALAALDIFVHPGDPEPFGLVNLEAMAMGKPVVAFAHGALPGIVTDGETGVLIPPGDEAALAKAVVLLLQDPARRAAMGRAGRTRVEECFTAERIASEMEATLQEVVK